MTDVWYLFLFVWKSGLDWQSPSGMPACRHTGIRGAKRHADWQYDIRKLVKRPRLDWKARSFRSQSPNCLRDCLTAYATASPGASRPLLTKRNAGQKARRSDSQGIIGFLKHIIINILFFNSFKILVFLTYLFDKQSINSGSFSIQSLRQILFYFTIGLKDFLCFVKQIITLFKYIVLSFLKDKKINLKLFKFSFIWLIYW
jgi:hypothetical protein